jgi:acetyl esterase/lipase
MGHSAGAHLAMLAAFSSGGPTFRPSTDVPPIAFRTVINIYGPTDLVLLYKKTRSPDFLWPHMWAWVGGTPAEYPARYSALSPLSHITENAPPTITFLGTSDRLVPVDHAKLLDAALSKAGVPHEMHLIPATDHDFDVNWGGFATQIVRDRLRRFLEKYDGGSATDDGG